MRLPEKINVFPENAKLDGKEIKFGIDPTFPTLHLGHLVPLRIVKKLQEDGRNVTIVLGTFTAQLGDPSGKEKTRPILTPEETEKNAQSILSQVKQILGDNFTVFKNGDLFNKMTVPEILTISSKFTTHFMMTRDAFQKRLEKNEPIHLHELIVPICQGWDSVHLKSDIEIGGTDQLFNFQVARKLQEQNGQNPETCLMMPIINGTDGRKMSKSLGNCIFLNEKPKDIFGKCMSISDDTMEEWLPLLTDLTDLPEHPMKRKKALAFDITKQLHGEEAANNALKSFENVIQKSELPKDMIKVKASDILSAVLLARKESKSGARRLIKQKSVSLNGKKVSEETVPVNSGDIIKIGKRTFAEIE
jgi:tyrosyl-tRNA synthetase